MAAGVDSTLTRQPLGVCVGITPFNFPLMVPLWMFPLAIACGNTFVLKPSDRVPRSSVRAAELLYEAGLPAGVLNVVTGDPIAIGGALMGSPVVRKLSFTGSTEVGRILMARDSGDSATLLVRGVYHAVPPTPYTRTFVVDYSQGYKSSQVGGVGWGDDSDKIVSCKNMVYDAGGIGMGGEYHDASGGIQSGPLVPDVYSGKMGLQVFRLSDNGSTRTCEWSMDGMNFLTIFSEANTNYLTPTRLIAMLTPGASSGQPSLLNFISYR